MFHSIQQLDFWFLDFIQSHVRTSSSDYFFVLLTSLGNGKFLWIALSYLLLLQKKTRKCGMLLTVGILLSAILGEEILKPLIGRTRPCYYRQDLSLLISKPRGYSFPSGHTLDSFVSATILYRYKKSLGIFVFIIAFLMGFSRLYLYVHFPSDVIAGAILGILFGNFIYKYSYLSQE